MDPLLIYFIVLLLTDRVNSSTHWIVTEDGRIQSQMDSPFNLQRPYDLVAMLKQEERAHILKSLKQELIMKKESIDRSEDRDTGLEQKFYRTDSDCIAAGKPLPEFDLYISTVLPLENKGIRAEEYLDFTASSVNDPVAPLCTEMMDLDYSIEAFEHLEGVRDRTNLTGSAELGLKNAITHRENVDDFGHMVYEALKKNKTSWELYNLAAFYWRIKGHPYNVVECVRRALHLSPRNHRDVALISLANILHRARYSHEAAIVVQAALDISQDLNVNHFTLGNIYAVLADYNKSVQCFENTLRIQPDFETAEKRKHAVLCHAKLETALEDQHRLLQKTLNDLKDYQLKHEKWQSLQDKLISEQVPPDLKFEQTIFYEESKIHKTADGIGEFCTFEEQDGKQVMQCSWGKKNVPKIEGADMLKPAQADRVVEPPRSAASSFPIQLVYLEPIHPVKYPKKNTVNPKDEGELEYKDPGWPSKEQCDMYVTKFPSWNEFPTTYLPPENKGFEVKLLLSAAQGLSDGMEHALPWYPPVCNLHNLPEGTPKTYDHIQSVAERVKLVQKVSDISMKDVLLGLVSGDITEAEVGQRILTAAKKEIGPPWLLYNLAALYWRVIGNSQHAIDCLRHAIYFVPKLYMDVPLVNLANLLYKVGRLDDAITVMTDVIRVNDKEPETHFFMGNILAAKGNITGAMHHYEEALLQEPDHAPAFSSIRTLKCYHKFHRTAQSVAPPPADTQTSKQQSSCAHSCSPSCRNKMDAANKGPVDSKLICRMDVGRENCVLETTAQNCERHQCSQSCHFSPLAMETCEGPNGLKCLGHNSHMQEPRLDGSLPKCPDDTDEKSCRTPVSLAPLSETIGPNPMSDPGFYDKLEAVKEYYRSRGLCTGEDCDIYFVQCITPGLAEPNVQSYMAQHFVYTHPAKPPPVGLPQCSQPNQHMPHTKLEVQDGLLHQKLILVDNPEDIVVRANDCIIYNDGRKTSGCQREEYRAFDFDVFSTSLLFSKTPSSHSNKQEDHSVESLDTDSNQIIQEWTKNHRSREKDKTDTYTDTDESEDYDIVHEEDEETDLEGFYWGEQGLDVVYEHIEANQEKSNILETENEKHVEDSNSVDLLDPLRHITVRTDLPWPTWDDCKRDYKQSDFREAGLQQFSSTWVSVSIKNIDVRSLIDFDDLIKGLQEPFCSVASIKSRLSPLDEILADIDVLKLTYNPELGLLDTLQKLGGDSESIGVVGTRIAKAMKMKPKSWAIANLAALYWRVEGDAEQAMKCLRVGYQLAPAVAKDIALLGMVNILYSTGQLDAALRTCNMALSADNTITATHFTMAKIYDAKGDNTRARSFYESTLGLQSSFVPAKERLGFLRCHKILSNPHVFKTQNPNSAKMEL